MSLLARSGDFFRFAALSGFGWLLDLSVLVLLVRAAGVSPYASNFCSSSLAAGMVFLISRRRIHQGAAGAVPLRLGLYLVYTLGVILAASFAIPLMMTWAAEAFGIRDRTLTVLIAKVVVTPPQLMLNFFVSRTLARHRWKRADAIR